MRDPAPIRPPPAWALWVCMALGMAVCAIGLSLRPPVAADAPASEFSAERAMSDVRLLASEPHPIGSPANQRVLEALQSRMTALGLSPEVHEGVGLGLQHAGMSTLSAGTVHNIIGILPGTHRELPAVTLMAHYDSVNNSPGAADDIANVATALEIARLLKAGGGHARDVMFVFTDGEEAGLLGADAFFHDDPALAHIGLVINMETRGDAGRAAMFQTGADSGDLVRLYAATAQHPYSTSLAASLYKLLPNDTDFTHALEHGLPGMNFAYIGDQLAYHTPLATPAHLSRASLQNMGDQVAPVTLALADMQTLPVRSPDLVYFDLFARNVVIYPAAMGWALVAAAASLMLLAWAGARRAAPDAPPAVRVRDVARGASTTLVAVLAAALAGHVAARVLDSGGDTSSYHLFRAFDLLFMGCSLVCLGATLGVYAAAGRRRGALVLAAVALLAAVATLWNGFDAFALTVAIVIALLGAWTARSESTQAGGWVGALLLLLVFTIACQALAPFAAPLFAWPLLLAAFSAALHAWLADRARNMGLVAVGAIAVGSLGILGMFAHGIFTALGPQLPELLALFSLLMLASVVPFVLAWSRSSAAPAVLACVFVAGIAAMVTVGLGTGSPDRPALSRAFYLAQGEDGPQQLVSPVPRLDAWEQAVLGADNGAVTRAPVAPIYHVPVWTAPAQHRALKAPTVRIERLGERTVVHANAAGAGTLLTLYLRSSEGIHAMTVNGRTTQVAAAPAKVATIAYSAPPPAGVTLEFMAGGGAAHVDVTAVERRPGWPTGFAAPPLPPTLMHWQDSATTSVSAHSAMP